MKGERESGSGYTTLHIGHTNGENIVNGCIRSLKTGIYNVDIFDINNNGQKESSGTAVTISTVQVFPPTQSSQPIPTDVSSTMYDSPTVSREYHVICHVMYFSVLYFPSQLNQEMALLLLNQYTPHTEILVYNVNNNILI